MLFKIPKTILKILEKISSKISRLHQRHPSRKKKKKEENIEGHVITRGYISKYESSACLMKILKGARVKGETSTMNKMRIQLTENPPVAQSLNKEQYGK